MDNQTKLKNLLGVTIPIIQAPMAGAQNWELAVAVAEANALGSIPCGMLGAEQIVAEIEAFTAKSDMPYNLNFFCHTMPDMDDKQLDVWQNTLTPYYREYSLEFDPSIKGLRRPFDKAIADAIEPYQPKVISFHFGLPDKALLDRVQSWGTTVLSTATTVEEGLWLEKNGADAVIAQGYEAGGHRGMFLSDDLSTQIATLPLVSQLVEQLSIPVIASGGICLSKDIKAMLDLGAAGVQLGTSYLLCDEAKTSQVHREAIKTPSTTTAITNLFSGRPARGIQNRLMQDLHCISTLAPEFPYASIALAPLRKAAESEKQSDFSPLWCGQNRSACLEISATQLTHDLWHSV